MFENDALPNLRARVAASRVARLSVRPDVFNRRTESFANLDELVNGETKRRNRIIRELVFVVLPVRRPFALKPVRKCIEAVTVVHVPEGWMAEHDDAVMERRHVSVHIQRASMSAGAVCFRTKHHSGLVYADAANRLCVAHDYLATRR